MVRPITEYTGKAYSLHGYNCWDHVCNVRGDAGLHTRFFEIKSLRDGFQLISENLSSGKHGLTKVVEPENFDVVLFTGVYIGRKNYHCGIYYDGFISHAYRKTKQVTIDKLSELKKEFKEVSFWR